MAGSVVTDEVFVHKCIIRWRFALLVRTADVMDKAVHIHHEVIRTCTARWTGYESATEGDSFLLSFHT